MKKLLFLINPRAGRTAIKNDLFEIINIFSNAGYRLEVYTTKGPDDAACYVQKNGKKYDVIVCAGGDGTLDNTISGMMKLKQKSDVNIPVGYIPCGSTNDFARSLRISRNPVEAARAIVEGDACPVDVGELEDKQFIYVAAFGAFTDISYSTSQKMKNVLGHSAYIIEAVKNLSNLKAYNIKAEFDNDTISGEFLYVQITNSLSVGGFRIIGPRQMSFSDGKFECLLIRKPNNPIELQKIINSIVTNSMNKDMIYHTQSHKVKITCEEEIPWTVDGEYGGNYKVAEINNRQRAVSIILDDKSTYFNLDEKSYDYNEDYPTFVENKETEIDSIVTENNNIENSNIKYDNELKDSPSVEKE